MHGLKVSLLGHPGLEKDGLLLKFDTRKILAMIAFLAVTGDYHSRETLITLLWPELDPSRARAGLRRNLSVLKKALGGKWLIVDRKKVGFDLGADGWLDVAEFRRLQGAWQEHGHPQSQVCPECLSALTDAVGLYRGDFLAGFSLRDSLNFDEWQFFQADSLRWELAFALDRLVQGLAIQGEYEPAIDYGRRRLALDPLHEPAHRNLMRLYAEFGQRAAALRQYGECQRLFEEELGAPLEDETEQLFKAIKGKRALPQPVDPTVTISQPDILNGRYCLGVELGRGSSGVVYQARDLLLEREVAVKVYSSALLGTAGQTRLLDEAQAVAKLNHPNIVGIFDAGETEDTSYIVTELVEGESLHTSRPEALDDILAIAQQVCAALEHAHSQGIVHRDLKPENIIITGDGVAKLTDFGLARPVASRLTSEGTIAGTVFYLAPELALGKPFDGRADLYALGVMLYELVSGRLPFTADDAMAVISQHLYASVVPPRVKNTEIPPALDALIVALLNKDPGDRPASAAEVMDLLASPQILAPAVFPLDEPSLLKRIGPGRLVGRDLELGQARGLWSKVLAGQGQMLLFSGEAGIGKTRLARELATHIQVSGGQVFVGSCYAEGGMPYAPFSQILRQIVNGESLDDFVLPDFVLADLLALVPALRLNYPEFQSNMVTDDPRSEQRRIFESLIIFFCALSDRAPLLLIVEDVHWADSGTLTLLRHLARHTRQRQILLVATFREVGLEEARLLHETLLDLNREGLVTQIRLPRLDRRQTEEMLALLFAEEITPTFLDGIYGETEGNPFYIEEVCKALVESGKLHFIDGRWERPSTKEIGIPQSVQVAIHSRVRVLSPDAQKILCLAAVLGREFEFETLLRASEWGEEIVVVALEDAEQAQLVEGVSRKAGGTYAFVHALIPATLVDGVRTLRRRQLHRQAAAAIEARHPDDIEALAHHYTQAMELEKAAYYLLQAGDRARGLYAHHEAIKNYRQALKFLEKVGNQEQVARTLMKLGLTYHNAFDFKAARKAYQEASVLSQRVAEVKPADLAPAPPHALRITAFEPTTLSPGVAMDLTSHVMIDQLFSGLVNLSPEMDVVPDVAQSWEVLEGGCKYVFHLRDDVFWSDGIRVTAGDFEFAWKHARPFPAKGWSGVEYLHYLLGAKTYHQGQLTDPELIGVHALDDFTLIVDLEEPTSYLPYLLSFVPTLPVPRHVVEKRGEDWTDLNYFVTNGPFRLAAWERGESLVLERNPTYHGPFTGNPQRLECTFIVGRAAEALEMYAKDRLDICAGLPPAEWAHARQRYAGEYISGPWLSTDFVGFDISRPPFDDQRVRQAFALATDREALAHIALGGYSFPATGGLVPPEMPGHADGIALPYDPEAAGRLLAEAGYPAGRGFPAIECLARDDPGHDILSEHLRAQWLENLGVEITWKEIAWALFPDKISESTPHLWLVSWYADYPDPDDFLRILWWFPPDWQNKEYDRLVEEARCVMNQKKRMKMYRQADGILVEETPLLPLCYGRFHMLVKPWVRKHRTSPLMWWSWKDVILEPH
jgi:ABC-type oligopeptide transport system substrate-binding subunit/DNA-binding SARP family transcriptional activator